ncbi:MAG: hypothetical protein ACI808_000521, partial [Paraglaciecola sp.]
SISPRRQVSYIFYQYFHFETHSTDQFSYALIIDVANISICVKMRV